MSIKFEHVEFFENFHEDALILRLGSIYRSVAVDSGDISRPLWRVFNLSISDL